jgi:hypothetical protein
VVGVGWWGWGAVQCASGRARRCTHHVPSEVQHTVHKMVHANVLLHAAGYGHAQIYNGWTTGQRGSGAAGREGLQQVQGESRQRDFFARDTHVCRGGGQSQQSQHCLLVHPLKN